MSTDTTDGETEDPIEYFIEDLTYHGKTDRTREAYTRVLREFESFLADPDRNPRGLEVAPRDATYRDCMAYIHTLRQSVSRSTVATYAAYLHRFYAYMTQVGVFDANPMALVVEEMDETVEKDPQRRDISIPEMRVFVANVTHPLHRAVIVTLLKTGMRVGELCNLDLRDVSISNPQLESEFDGEPRAQLSGRPNSMYVPGEPTAGDEYNGEVRTASNKRQRETILPIDDELRRVFLRWLAIRPDARSSANPVFVNTSEDWGDRLDPAAVRHIVERYTREHGWYHTGGGAAENVTPHYFRHFFTTHLRDRTGDRGIVKYLRGDVADDIIDTYTHNWGDQVRETYEANIYSLLHTESDL